MRYGTYLRNELRLQGYLLQRYWQESLAAFAALLMVLLGLLYAVVTLGEVTMESGRLDGLILGSVLWLFAGAAFASTAGEVADEIRQRTLEQLCIAPLALSTILGLRAIVKLAAAAVTAICMLLIVEVSTQPRLVIEYGALVGVLLLAAPSLTGLGYAMAGIVLIARKIDGLLLLAYPSLLLLVACPATPSSATALLPYTLGASAARSITAGELVPWYVYALTGVISIGWLLLGTMIFRRCEHHARKLGIMGHV